MNVLRGWVLVSILGLAGCQSLSYTDQGLLAGGATGAGVGALIGEATGGNAGAGAILGAGLGAIGGGLVGNGLDEVEARNRAAIAHQMGRMIPPGGVQVNDIMAMVGSRVDEELIVNHIRANGVAQPLSAQDVIALQQQGVSKNIIADMQTAPRPQMQMAGPMPAQAVAVPQYVYPYPPPYYGPPPGYWRPGFYYSQGYRRPHSSIGFAISN